jgi:lycopene beta-cyclase
VELFINIDLMDQTNRYDIIIAGSGASGLSLLWHILQSHTLRQKRILLIDRILKPVNDKTWCFWDNSRMPFKGLIHHTWGRLEVEAYGNTFTETLEKYRYHCMRSADYSADLLKLADKSPNVTMLETDIKGFRSNNGEAVAETSAGIFTATYIFQSALKPPALKDSKNDILLKQHFMGWEIKTRENRFDPDKVTLMDFDVPQVGGVTFFYILPFSETEALIEYTFFTSTVLSDEEYERGIVDYLQNKLNLEEGSYTITRKEKGVIPMEDRRYPSLYCEGVYNLGTSGGLTKPSTGYTFTRIHRHSRNIVNALEAGKIPSLDPTSPYRFRVYDMMLLWLLKNRPETSVTIFRDLFKRNSFDRILTFLEENTHLGQELKIFSSLPYMPFFQSIWKMKHRIFTGA